MKLLIVDDSPNVRRLIREVITDLVREIFECADGETAIQFYNHFKPDLVLMDIKMKKVNGLISTKKILKTHPEARIVIVSNYIDEQIKIEARVAGAIGYFTKEEIYMIPEYIKEVLKNCA